MLCLQVVLSPVLDASKGKVFDGDESVPWETNGVSIESNA